MLGLAVGILAVEVALHVVGPKPGNHRSKRLLRNSAEKLYYHCYPSNPSGELRELPKVVGDDWEVIELRTPPAKLDLSRLSKTPWGVRYQRTSRGFRGSEIPIAAKPGVTRMGMVGDSFVFGEGVWQERTLPAQIQDLLGDEYDVLNLGLPGANFQADVQLATAAAGQLGCRRVVVVFVPNDVALSDELTRRQNDIHDLINIRAANLDEYERDAWYSGPSRILYCVGSYFAWRRITNDTIQWYLDSYKPEKNGDNLLQLAQLMQKLAELPDCKVALVLYPLMEGLDAGYPLAPVHEYVAKTAARAGLPVLDLAPAFANRPTDQLWVHPVDHHPNGRAHEIAAKAIVDWLEGKEMEGFLTVENADVKRMPE